MNNVTNQTWVLTGFCSYPYMLPSQECLLGLFLGADQAASWPQPGQAVAELRLPSRYWWYWFGFVLSAVLLENAMENVLSQRCLSFWNIWSKPRLNPLEGRKDEWRWHNHTNLISLKNRPEITVVTSVWSLVVWELPRFESLELPQMLVKETRCFSRVFGSHKPPQDKGCLGSTGRRRARLLNRGALF